MAVSKTVIISCAGAGKRLGLNTSKCLVDVAGETLILRNLKMLDSVDDVRVVVGFRAESVIEMVTAYRRDVTFVFNHDYARTNTGDSVRLAAEYANEYILTIDGDLLVHPDDMRALLAAEGEFVGVTTPGSDNPVLCEVEGGNVVGFSREVGSFEWTGVTQVRTERILDGTGHTYQLIEPSLPMPYRYIRTKEIDTPDDYERAVRWVRGGYSDEVTIGIVGGMGSYATVDFFRRLVDAFPARYEWERPRILIDNRCTMPSRVRAVLYGECRDELIRQLSESVENLVEGGSTHVFLACNTSHVFLDEMKSFAPRAADCVVDMIALLAADAARRGIARAFLLASEGTIASGIYQDRFAAEGIEVSSADVAMQKRLRDFIEAVKQNKVDDAVISDFAEFVRGLEEPCVILGCTELPLLMDGEIEGVTMLDPMQAAIDYAVKVYAANRLGR